MTIIRRCKIQTLDNNKTKVTVVVGEDTSENPVSTVEVKIPSKKGNPTTVTNSIVLTPYTEDINGDKHFVFQPLNFSSNPIGCTYTVVATMKNRRNSTIGNSSTVNVTVTEAS